MEYVQVMQMCRICLNIQEEHEMFSIYNIAQKIVSFACVKISKDDGLPNLICFKCYKVARLAYAFKEKCELSEKLLKTDATIASKLQILKEDEQKMNLFKVKFLKEDVAKTVIHESFVKPLSKLSNKVKLLQQIKRKSVNSSKKLTFRQNSQNKDSKESDDFKDMCCRFCDFRANSWKNCYKHEISHGKGIECYLCGKSCMQLRTMTNHLVFHRRKGAYPCTECDKKFTLRENLSKHMKRHLGIRPYSCSVCNKSFTERSELRIHASIHITEKPFLCNICGNKYARKRLLTVHIEKNHPEPGKALLLCTLCGKGYRDLRLHMMFHKNERKFVCKICSKAFNSRSNLKTHENIHAEKRPYSCSLCPKGFNQKHVLRTHLKRYHHQFDGN